MHILDSMIVSCWVKRARARCSSLFVPRTFVKSENVAVHPAAATATERDFSVR